MDFRRGQGGGLGFQATEQQHQRLAGYYRVDPTVEGQLDAGVAKGACLPCQVYRSLVDPVGGNESERICE